MGASHTTLASTSGGEEAPPDLEGDLGAYAMDQHLFPGSGRMMRTFRLRHKQTSSTVVLKSMWVAQEHQAIVSQQEKELQKIQAALVGQPHVAPFLYWSIGNYRTKVNSNNLTVRQISLLRPHTYTTLSDRLASRPFLTHVEKLWIVYQILQALDAMHDKKIVHGFLTTENIGLSSWNWVTLVDVASYKARTALPDDDPSEYLYYFQELYKNQGTDTITPREKRCYLAPERFYTPNKNLESNQQQLEKEQPPPLTPAMDIFSAGCVIMETFLNGERALDLGDLMEYRKRKSCQTLQQKLNKIEFSAVRAACRHMLHLDSSERLSASAYLERLKVSELVPESFETLASMMEQVTYAAPDARLAVAATYYSSVMWETLGIRDKEGEQYVANVLGSTMTRLKAAKAKREGSDRPDEHVTNHVTEEKKEDSLSNTDLFAETEALLKKLESLNFNEDEDENEVLSIASKDPSMTKSGASEGLPSSAVKRSEMSQSSLLIFLQLILSTVRHVQRPASKLVALQLMKRVGKYSTDEARLERIVPVTVSLLQDQDPLVRASAIHVLATTVSTIDAFPPSDSKVFPQYIFKRVAHMITDPSLVVRLAFARSVAILAETAHRFLDISHAVRLYEVVGGGGGGTAGGTIETSKEANNVFTDDIAKLLDESPGQNTKAKKKLEATDSGVESTSSEGIMGAGKTLISSTYSSELAGLHETVSKWVVHITTDQSEHSSPAKRALLGDMARLCNFFGLDGVMAFILPQILSFLNDRKDWQLRAALFECLPSVCHIIGRAATEHFVLPCLEIALVDGEEPVISRALQCLSELLRMGLLSRALLLGVAASSGSEPPPGLLKKYGALLVHPSADVRFFAISTVNALCKSIGHPDGEVFVVPILRPFLRFQPSMNHLNTRDGLEMCLHSPWTRKRFHVELHKLLAASSSSLPPTSGEWTSIAFKTREGDGENEAHKVTSAIISGQGDSDAKNENKIDLQTEQVRAYLQMLARSRTYHMKAGSECAPPKDQLNHVIEGSLKLSQQIKFPRQNIPGLPAATIPAWYSTLRDAQESRSEGVSESAAIRSVSALGQVYGLSIMDQSEATSFSSSDMTADHAVKILRSEESQAIEAACTGEWGSETCLDPTLTDTSLLVTKLNALQVPPLPPKLAEERASTQRVAAPAGRPSAKEGSSGEWKPKIDKMVASSKCSPDVGHTAPIVRLVVSHDQRFFVTGSQDGTCGVWEVEKAEKGNGVLESGVTYSGHSSNDDSSIPRVNDLAMVEGGHSVVSGDSNGSIHLWRVDMVSSSTKASSSSSSEAREISRVAGSSEVRRIDPQEGEILTVNHFNTSSASVFTFASQKGYVHSWDLRCASEPFLLKNPQDSGYITSMAMGSDRNWVATGTSRGFIAIWDLRFQQILKLWHHSRSAPINRLATSFVPPPQSWAGKGGTTVGSRPFLFAACGPNECAMFDVTDGSCKECFRTVDYGNRFFNNRLDEIPRLVDVPLSTSARRKVLVSQGLRSGLGDVISSSFRSVNAMVGSIGASDHSFLITGGSDCRIRYWDFAVPSKCYVSSGVDAVHPRPSFERIDYDHSCRLMLCRQPPSPTVGETESSRAPEKLYQGLSKPESSHQDSIQDLKVVRSGLLSCSRDCTVKLWR